VLPEKVNDPFPRIFRRPFVISDDDHSQRFE